MRSSRRSTRDTTSSVADATPVISKIFIQRFRSEVLGLEAVGTALSATVTTTPEPVEEVLELVVPASGTELSGMLTTVSELEEGWFEGIELLGEEG